MAALVQSLPQQSGPATMLQPRVSGQSSPHQAQHQLPQQAQTQRIRPAAGYRPAASPIQPYAFTSTPSLGPSPHLQHRRSSSTSSNSTSGLEIGSNRFASTSMTNLTQSTHPKPMIGARDDSVLPSQSRISPTSPHPQSFHIPGSSAQISHTQPTLASKSIPDRYRRVGLRHSDGMIASQGSAVSSGSSMATVGHIYAAPSPVLVGRHRIGNENGNKGRPGSFAGKVVLGAMDDMQVGRQRVPEEAKRFRRRSIHTLDSTDYPSPLTPQALFAQQVNSEKFSRPQPAALQHQHVQPQLQPQKMSAISSRPITANPSVPTGSPNSRHSHHDSADSARSSYSANDNIGAGSCSGSNSRPSSSVSTRKSFPFCLYYVSNFQFPLSFLPNQSKRYSECYVGQARSTPFPWPPYVQKSCTQSAKQKLLQSVHAHTIPQPRHGCPHSILFPFI